MHYYAGIDIGSTSAKTVVMDRDGQILTRFLQPTGWSSMAAANEILIKMTRDGYDSAAVSVVATGYGRVSVPYAQRCITEITRHGLGAAFIYRQNNLIVLDIGGQDTKIIRVEGGAVRDFVMNDKCSAGTGRFLEIMANTLAVSPSALCELAASGGNTSISSMCTVFAESEVISLIGRGEQKENIAFAVVDSIVKKVVSQASRLSVADLPVCLTGGLCECEYVRAALETALGVAVYASPDGRYAGAVGAALTALADEQKGITRK